ncbi:MAG: TolC family protein [Bacteroidetes bacterium]|nr:TolC family protein [Bacteroidota bacterium]
MAEVVVYPDTIGEATGNPVAERSRSHQKIHQTRGFSFPGILAALLLFSAIPGHSQSTLSLPEAIEKARAAHEQIRIEQLKAESAALTSDQAFNNRLPSLKASGRFTRQSEVDPFAISLTLPPPVGTINRVVSESIEDAAAFRLTLTQPLFTGFKLTAAEQAAEWQAKAAGMDVKTRQQELSLQVTRAYGQVLLAEKQVELTSQLVNLLTKRLSDAESMAAQGLLTETEVLAIRVKKTETEAEAIYAADRLQVARLGLGQWLGSSTAFTGTLAPMEIPVLSPQPSERPELSGLTFRKSAISEQIKVARSDWFPTIALQANYDLANPNPRYFPVEQAWKSTWDVSLVLSYEIWTWNTRFLQTQQADLARNQMDLQESLLRKSITLEQQAADAALARSEKLVAVMQLLSEQTRKRAEQVANQFRAGLIPVADLLDADVQATQAALQAEAARINWMTDRLVQAKAWGRLL